MRADVLRLRHRHRQCRRVVNVCQRDVFRSDTELEFAFGQGASPRQRQCAPGHLERAAGDARRQEVHARRADEMADEGVLRPLEQCVGAAHLHRAALRHHHHLVRKRQRLDLVVRHIDQREFQLMVDLLQLAPQLPLQVWVDHRQRFVEQHRRYIGSHQAAAERDLLLGVGRKTGGALVELAAQLQHLGDFADPLCDLLFRHLAIAQRKSKVVGHGHGVVDHRKLEHLGDVALLRAEPRHVATVEFDGPLQRRQQARHEVEHRRLAAAGGPEQRIGAAVGKAHLQRQQRVVRILPRVGLV
jgi:hypothetical protein